MKVPGQRSSFHICDILDLNTNSDTKNDANAQTTFAGQTTTHSATSLASARDDTATLNGSTTAAAAAAAAAATAATTIPPYHLPSNINSAMYPDLAPHYHSMFPAMTKSWLKESEAYGKLQIAIPY